MPNQFSFKVCELTSIRRSRQQNRKSQLLAISTGVRYGNTQALVLVPSTSFTGSKILTRGSQAIDEATLERIEFVASSLEVDDYPGVPAGCPTAFEALPEYRRFPKLYEERRLASKYVSRCLSHHHQPLTYPLTRCQPSQKHPSPTSFPDLPGELRNNIYRLALVSDPPYIDLCPKTCLEGSNGPPRAHHMKRFRKEVCLNIRLLRTNKQISKEAASIIYGENEWRFTSCKAFYVLDAFLAQIGPENVARIRRLAVHVPWQGRMAEFALSCKDSLPESQKRMSVMQTTIERMGLTPKHWWKDFCNVACVARTKHMLEEAGKLERLRLLLPDSWMLGRLDNTVESDVDVRFLAPEHFEHLEVMLVSLRGGMQNSSKDVTSWKQHRLSNIARQSVVKEVVKKYGWGYAKTAYDEKGYWPVKAEAGSALEELVMATW